MKRTLWVVATMAVCVSGSYLAFAQGAAPQTPSPMMTFFITSTGPGNGADLGGLAGADRQCQTLATAVGAGDRMWRAYLSTDPMPGQLAINARDRIGPGPFVNFKGTLIAANVNDLHTLDKNFLSKQNGLNEKGQIVKGFGDTPNQHDILTGSTAEGRSFNDSADHTCSNYTSSRAAGIVRLGHFDKMGGGTNTFNSTHDSRGCSQPNLVSTGGAGLLYCFALPR
jgi:hypothetical protein